MIEKKLVFVDTECSNQEEVLNKILQEAKKLEYIDDIQEFLDAIIARETMIPTSVGFHVAIPHGRSKTVNEPFVAFMKTSTDFVWDNRNGESVDLIFLIGVPEENKNNLHLKCLSMISRKLMQDGFREALRCAKDADVAFEILNEIDKQIKGEE